MVMMMMTTNQGLGRSSDSLLVRSCSIPESIAAKWEMEEYLIVVIIIDIVIIFIIKKNKKNSFRVVQQTPTDQLGQL